jgi:CubicO group peptidase (beta-lactamase class C family)
MTALKIEVDPSDAGFAPERLERIDRHFEGYIEQRKLAGWHIAISRSGSVVHSSTRGHRDLAAELPFTDDSVVRMFSMTKPITSVAAMMLYEEGLLELKSPISKWLPEFADTRVYRSGSFVAPVTEPQIEPIRVWHLLTHTSGLTYGFHNTHVTDAIYRRGGFEWGNPPGATLASVARCGRRCPSHSSRAASGTTACRPMCSAASSRWCRA